MESTVASGAAARTFMGREGRLGPLLDAFISGHKLLLFYLLTMKNIFLMNNSNLVFYI